MRRPLVAGNWKMNGSLELLSELADGLVSNIPSGLDIAVFPPFVYLSVIVAKMHAARDQSTHKSTDQRNIEVGAQNVDWRAQGALTGEVDTTMLQDLGCTMCLVGHSERRQWFAETDETVALKTAASLEAGLVPIICIGETLAQREAGDAQQIVQNQLRTVLDKVGVGGIARSVIAYEPVWAIGTGKSASPEQAQEIHASIRELLRQVDPDVADTTRILYGGSVNPGNAQVLFAQADIDGALVGGASLVSADFISICKAATEK